MSEQTAEVSLLTQRWIGDFEGNHTLLLKADGSGEILSRSEMTVALAAHVTWKLIESGPVDDTPAPEQSFISKILRQEPPSTTALIATLELTITKSTEPMSLVPESYNETIGGDRTLKDSGLESRRFQVVVQRGEFLAPFWKKLSGIESPKYGLRISFDSSPYPASKDWVLDARDMADAVHPFTRVSFVAQEL